MTPLMPLGSRTLAMLYPAEAGRKGPEPAVPSHPLSDFSSERAGELVDLLYSIKPTYPRTRWWRCACPSS